MNTACQKNLPEQILIFMYGTQKNLDHAVQRVAQVKYCTTKNMYSTECRYNIFFLSAQYNIVRNTDFYFYIIFFSLKYLIPYYN